MRISFQKPASAIVTAGVALLVVACGGSQEATDAAATDAAAMNAAATDDAAMDATATDTTSMDAAPGATDRAAAGTSDAAATEETPYP